MKKLGIENIMFIISFGLSFGNELDQALEDKSLSFGEALGFLDNLNDIDDVIEAVKRAPAEFLDLDAQEKEQIQAMVTKDFDIANDMAEEAIEESFGFALSTFRYVMRMRKIFASKNAA